MAYRLTRHTKLVGILVVVALSGGAAMAYRSDELSRDAGKVIDFSLPDSAGKLQRLDDLAGKRATIIVFLSTDCPMSNSYIESIQEMASTYESKGVKVILANPNAQETPEQVARHASDFHIRLPVVRDTKLELTDALGARATPEAFLLGPERTVRYRGRIDDQYISRLKRREGNPRHDLREALDELLAGKPISRAETEPLGCPIARPVAPKKTESAPTFARDVMNILQQRCQSCHRPGQGAPFSLMNYTQAVKWSADIERVTGERLMPPWKPRAGFGEFRDEQRLSDAEIATIAAWVEAGMPEGNPADLPPPRDFGSGGWQLGEPDLVLTMTGEFEIHASGRDIVRQFVIPTELLRDQWVTAVEFHAGNARVAHHAIFFTDTTGRARQLDAEDPDPGFSRFGFIPSGNIGGWAVGTQPQPLPAGVGMRLQKGSDLVLQMHYHPTGRVERDQSSLGVYFAKAPIEKQVAGLPVFGLRFQWPADDDRIPTTGRFRVPVDVHAISVFPHMHMLGREFKMTATRPDGTVVPLIDIDDWDFNWQQAYYYKSPVALPKGTIIDLESYADNSTKNPVNPNSPPRSVRFGEQSTDEMCIGFVGCTADNNSDVLDLLRLRRPRQQGAGGPLP
jgi:mono/diheme cytochrome c family protein/peroxiredoxin